MSRTPPPRAGLLPSLLAAATTGCGLVGDPPPGPLDALRTLCGQDAEVREDDPSEEEGYDLETVGEGREEQWSTSGCPAVDDGPYDNETVYAARYDRDPAEDMKDRHQAYADADGSSVTWAVAEGAGRWTVVWSPRSGVDDYESLAATGFEVVSGG